jgi:hypothetical protein
VSRLRRRGQGRRTARLKLDAVAACTLDEGDAASVEAAVLAHAWYGAG